MIFCVVEKMAASYGIIHSEHNTENKYQCLALPGGYGEYDNQIFDNTLSFFFDL